MKIARHLECRLVCTNCIQYIILCIDVYVIHFLLQGKKSQDEVPSSSTSNGKEGDEEPMAKICMTRRPKPWWITCTQSKPVKNLHSNLRTRRGDIILNRKHRGWSLRSVLHFCALDWPTGFRNKWVEHRCKWTLVLREYKHRMFFGGALINWWCPVVMTTWVILLLVNENTKVFLALWKRKRWNLMRTYFRIGDPFNFLCGS
jgi:hypothetical protein